MGIPCRMLPQLPYANQFRLLAGESGLGNEVQWVHYLEEPRYAAWLRGGELILTAGAILGDDPKALCCLAEELFDRGAAGLVISISEFIPAVPTELQNLCDRLGLPLYEVPAQVRILDINQSIWSAIFRQRKEVDETQRILLDVLYGKRMSEKRLQRLRAVGVREEQNLRVVLFQVEDWKGRPETPRETAFYEEEGEEQYRDEIFSLLREEILRERGHCPITLYEDDILWVAEAPQGQRLQPLLQELLGKLEQRLPGTEVRIGVSEIFQDIRALRTHAGQARDALALSQQRDQGKKVTFYDDLVCWQLFRRAGSREALAGMADRVLGPLLAPERAELLETLACYIAHDCNAKETAKALFLHVNTMRYRLDKIQTLLPRDLDRMEDLFDIMLALKLQAFCNWENENGPTKI